MFKFITIILSFLLSLMLSIAPLSANLLPINPPWCLLTVLFWTYEYPRRVNIGTAWCLGILLDGLTGSLLGLHALAFISIVFIFDLFYRRFHMFPLLQQSLVVGALVACYLAITLCLDHVLTHDSILWVMMLGAVSSGLCWPVYHLLGQKFHLTKG